MNNSTNKIEGFALTYELKLYNSNKIKTLEIYSHSDSIYSEFYIPTQLTN